MCETVRPRTLKAGEIRCRWTGTAPRVAVQRELFYVNVLRTASVRFRRIALLGLITLMLFHATLGPSWLLSHQEMKIKWLLTSCAAVSVHVEWTSKLEACTHEETSPGLGQLAGFEDSVLSELQRSA